MRVGAALVFVVLASLAGASVGDARSGAAPTCRRHEYRPKVEAVFGHFATAAEAQAFLGRVTRNGFKNVDVEDDGCGNFEVELEGIDSAQRAPFALEAARAHFEVSFEQTEQPDSYHRGFVNGVFGTRNTIAAANDLERRVASLGFRYVDIARSAVGWRVIAPRIRVSQERPFRAEATRVRLALVFVS